MTKSTIIQPSVEMTHEEWSSLKSSIIYGDKSLKDYGINRWNGCDQIWFIGESFYRVVIIKEDHANFLHRHTVHFDIFQNFNVSLLTPIKKTP